MKKIFLIFIILLCGCTNKEIVVEKELIIIDNIKTTSSSISFSSNIDNKNYKLYLEDKLIKEDILNINNEIDNLEPNKEYKLIIDDNNYKINTNKITKLMFGGDVLMDLFFENYINANGVDYPWQHVSEYFKTSDIAMINLETSVSDKGSSTKPKGYGFRSKPFTLEGLVNSSIDIVTIANNHVLDYGYDAFLDTMTNLDKYGIKHVGAGKNINEAIDKVLIEVNDIKLCFMASTSILGFKYWASSDDNGGVAAFTEDYYDVIFNKIKEEDSKCDYIIYNVHWGTEYTNYPKELQAELAHKLIDSGVDILIGHHPHVLQGIEYYNDKPIFYSIGNFNFLINDTNSSRTGLFEINLDNKKLLSMKVYPILISSCKANILDKTNEIYSEVINNLNTRSKEYLVNIDMDGNITK